MITNKWYFFPWVPSEGSAGLRLGRQLRCTPKKVKFLKFTPESLQRHPPEREGRSPTHSSTRLKLPVSCSSSASELAPAALPSERQLLPGLRVCVSHCSALSLSIPTPSGRAGEGDSGWHRTGHLMNNFSSLSHCTLGPHLDSCPRSEQTALAKPHFPTLAVLLGKRLGEILAFTEQTLHSVDATDYLPRTEKQVGRLHVCE